MLQIHGTFAAVARRMQLQDGRGSNENVISDALPAGMLTFCSLAIFMVSLALGELGLFLWGEMDGGSRDPPVLGIETVKPCFSFLLLVSAALCEGDDGALPSLLVLFILLPLLLLLLLLLLELEDVG